MNLLYIIFIINLMGFKALFLIVDTIEALFLHPSI
jgi:hypothetical protein